MVRPPLALQIWRVSFLLPPRRAAASTGAREAPAANPAARGPQAANPVAGEARASDLSARQQREVLGRREWRGRRIQRGEGAGFGRRWWSRARASARAWASAGGDDGGGGGLAGGLRRAATTATARRPRRRPWAALSGSSTTATWLPHRWQPVVVLGL
ncbi:uncharacterized protein [Oryza sativa Japonica Group]|jgi:hypothetical protein|uniref:Expressed protein n=2 Tax=Oryza sativa subsp. japonica TaxID=39947 RepID=Q33BF8_ORYSJ|nr:uncharacterized protein LOC4347972 [Oryza sativa Japonica Group]ABB46611.1 expressed protein [Oryza sativa Japonica Group]KAF2912383.1 hypothetical protein DAI22_10g005500 [Oryza sativa Japonica Group]BAF25952.1 Os10g0111800 [Oryza sativa Japonica Group]BAG97860.1 unnamed protein product [Oryza sativa Japonica Group]BAT09637.1 Os10g0111800 [Oryza sativa Japonica Group]|eukprot:NP_001064038.1 Os10g0111800 [Oryza sativa Japonica Group]